MDFFFLAAAELWLICPPLFWYVPLQLFLPLIDFYLYSSTTSHLISQKWSTSYMSGEKSIDNIIEEFLNFLPIHLKLLDPLPYPWYLSCKDNLFTFALDPILFISKYPFPYCVFDFSLSSFCSFILDTTNTFSWRKTLNNSQSSLPL